jgi:hypothetical protein
MLKFVVIAIVLTQLGLIGDVLYTGPRKLDPVGAQVALLIPMLASGLGLFNSFRMLRLPDIEPSSGDEGAVPT